MRQAEGRSIKEIASLLGVSRSSVSLWVRDIPLTEEQHLALRLRNPIYNGQQAGARANAERARERRADYQENGRRLARCSDLHYAAGCMLYWAEGEKTRHAVRFVNSDPEMIRFFLSFLRRYFSVGNESVRVSCNLFAESPERQREIERFWLVTLALPKSCLRKSTVNQYSARSSRKRKNKLPYGTCRIVVHDTRVVQAIYGSIQEYAGFRREEWLDGPS